MTGVLKWGYQDPERAEGRQCEDTGNRWLPTSQGESLEQILPSQPSRTQPADTLISDLTLQNCDTNNFYRWRHLNNKPSLWYFATAALANVGDFIFSLNSKRWIFFTSPSAGKTGWGLVLAWNSSSTLPFPKVECYRLGSWGTPISVFTFLGRPTSASVSSAALRHPYASSRNGISSTRVAFLSRCTLAPGTPTIYRKDPKSYQSRF